MTRPTPAARVETITVDLLPCPVCREPITGEVTVAVHVRGVTLAPPRTDAYDRVRMEANVDATSELRAMRVRHDCTPTPQAVDEETPLCGAPLVDERGDLTGERCILPTSHRDNQAHL